MPSRKHVFYKMSELSGKEEHFRQFVNATSDMVYRMSPDWVTVYELEGRGFSKANNVLFKDWCARHVHPDDLELVNAVISQSILTKEMYELEHRVIRADGSIGWIISRAIPIMDDDGGLVEWLGTVSDISQRKFALEHAETLKLMYETITSNTPDLIYVFALDYTFTYANKALLNMWGKTWEQAIGKNLIENGYEQWHAEMHEREIDAIVETGKPVRGEVSFPHAVLGKRIYDYILTPVFDQSGKVLAVSGITRDVTEHRAQEREKLRLSYDLAILNEQAEAANEELLASNEDLITAQELLGGALEKLNRSENKLRYLISNAPVAIALLTGRGMVIDMANSKILEIWGKEAGVVGKPLIEALPELAGQSFPTILDEVFTSGKAYFGNEARVILQGRELFINFVYQPLPGEGGETDSIVVTATDVTELVSSRHKVEQAETALRLAIEAADFGTWWINPQTRELVASDRLKELFGFLPSDSVTIPTLVGQINEEYRAEVTSHLESTIASGGHYDISYPVTGHHDKVLRWLRAVGNLKADPAGGFSDFTGVVMDITEAHLSAKTIERAEESLRMAIDAAELGSYYINVKDRIFVASPKLKEFFGFLPDDEVPYEAAIGQIHEDYRQAAADLVEASITKGIRFDMEYPVVGYRDGKIRWVRGIGTVQQQNNGVDSYFTGVLHEITERKQDEMRKNDFIAMVSHELKTPLTSLSGHIQLLQRRAEKNQDNMLSNSLDNASRQVKKMAEMINGFLNISRLESGKIVLEKSAFELHELIVDTVADMRYLAPDRAIFYESNIRSVVHADRNKIGNVLSNLLSNAIKYSPSNSKVSVTFQVVGNMARVNVIDEGRGLKALDLEKIFDRYYRVEDNSHVSGFGIGLYLSEEIIQRHDGRIWAESEYQKGSVFSFELPVA